MRRRAAEAPAGKAGLPFFALHFLHRAVWLTDAQMNPVNRESPARTDRVERRAVLVVVTDWPSGTMAMKFGAAMQAALDVAKEDMSLVQMAPERIFRVETTVSETEFREALRLRNVSSGGAVLFVDIPKTGAFESRRPTRYAGQLGCAWDHQGANAAQPPGAVAPENTARGARRGGTSTPQPPQREDREVAKSSLRLIYGTDPWAEVDDINLVVLDLAVVELLYQMRDAKTWGEATRGFPDILARRNEERLDDGGRPLELDDPFDFQTESQPESGAVYLVNLNLYFDDLVVDERLRPHVHRDGHRGRCWLRDDETASLALDLLRKHQGGEVTLVRDDSSVGYMMEGLFG